MAKAVDRQRVLLGELAQADAAAARVFAVRVRALAELADVSYRLAGSSGVEQFVELELAGSCRLGRLAASRELADAARYVEALPVTVALLARGELYVPQARVLLAVTENCPVEVARAVEARVLPAGVELCPPDLRRLVTRTVLAVESERDSQAVLDRLAAARAKRRVWVRPDTDGMAVIGVTGSAEQARQWLRDLDALVAVEKTADRAAGVWRSADQIRADLILAMPGLLLAGAQRDGRAPTLPRADTLISIQVPAGTVLGYADAPGELDGYGPISAEHVRLLLADAHLRRILIDSQTGQPLATDPTLGPPASSPATQTSQPPTAAAATRPAAASPANAVPADTDAAGIDPADTDRAARDAAAMQAADVEVRRRISAFLLRPAPAIGVDPPEPQHDPSRRLRRFIELRDLRCRGVGCSHPASRCHLDHQIAYPAGPTHASNLHALSASCHRAKHAGWHPTIHPDGATTWTSPLGRTYHRPPPHQPPPRLRATPRPAARPRPAPHDDHGSDLPVHLPARLHDPSPAADRPRPPTTPWPDEPPF